ncbi:hypothetical protein QYF36_011274 [Acer negundo]|nr:hypothetical protein QYF36_011274 [Acer negundo]
MGHVRRDDDSTAAISGSDFIAGKSRFGEMTKTPRNEFGLAVMLRVNGRMKTRSERCRRHGKQLLEVEFGLRLKMKMNHGVYLAAILGAFGF